ncbi:PAS domain-containing sensor histidine kinase [uncultured Mucilaginibacter sp.]|uniref:PAS domain-containing sensor histidine kinase n=1 Tax=uncultured Mucilaginibacter sp. TaxID=797541 RepID=UPI0025DFF4C2|nr:PAS domain-containing sensor histidine kinase [uncultured Mucilaginibacter sp.]
MPNNEQLFQQIFKISAACLLLKVSGSAFTIIDASDQYLALTSTSRAQLIGKDVFEIFPDKEDHPDGAISTRNAIVEVVRTGKQFVISDYLYHIQVPETGQLEPFWWTSTFDPLYNENGKVDYVLGTAVDNTLQHISNYHLNEAEQILRLAIEAADIGTWSINADTKGIVSSDRSKELYGLQKNEHITIDEVISAIDSEYREKVFDLLNQSLQSDGSQSFVIDYPVKGIKDGKRRWLRSNAKMFFNISGNERVLCGTLLDITDIKLAEQNKNDFIGMVSHELKTPLTTITAVMQLARHKLKESDKKPLLDAIERGNVQVKRMAAMIKGFLDISRLESGQMILESSFFDIGKLLHEVVEELRLIELAHPITLVGISATQVYADRVKISSVISNLINNATKYSPNGKPIVVTCEKTEEAVSVSVRDEGIGISQQDLNQIFDRYYRAGGAHTRNISGFGIGLYLSSEIIKKHQGKIWVDTAQDVGSTFYFTLPLQ